MSDSTTAEPGGSSPWTRPRFVIAAAVVALIAVFAVVLAVTRPGSDAGTAAPPQTSPPPATASSTPVPDASVCGLQPGDQSVPVTAPTDTEWELVGTVAAPTAPDTIGPGRIDDGLRTCFARSPLGALYAAVNFLATSSDPHLRLRTAEDLAAQGAGREAAINLLQEGDPGGSDSGLQVAGFSFLNYDQYSAVVDIAMTVDSTVVHLPVSLRWEGGDWKVVLPPTGQPFDAIQPLPDLTGYIPWAGA